MLVPVRLSVRQTIAYAEVGVSASFGRDQRVSGLERDFLNCIRTSAKHLQATSTSHYFPTGIAHVHLLHLGVVGDAL